LYEDSSRYITEIGVWDLAASAKRLYRIDLLHMSIPVDKSPENTFTT